MVTLPSRVVWCPAWVFARCSGRHLLFRLIAVVGPSGTGMTWSWSHRWAGVVQIGVVQVPSRKSMAVPSLREGNRHGVACDEVVRRNRTLRSGLTVFVRSDLNGDVEEVALMVGEESVEQGAGLVGEVADQVGGDEGGAVGELAGGVAVAEQ